jgi:hypothetical protein
MDSVPRTLVVTLGDSVVWNAPLGELPVSSNVVSTGVLPPGSYVYRVDSAAGESVGSGRFDVAATTLELASPAFVPGSTADGDAGGRAEVERGGSPLRTLPWPYLVVIGLLCAEWIGRRRSGLR